MKDFEKIHYKHFKKTPTNYFAPGKLKLLGDYLGHTGGGSVTCLLNVGVRATVHKCSERKLHLVINESQSQVINMYYDNILPSSNLNLNDIASLVLTEFANKHKLIVGIEGFIHLESIHSGIDVVPGFILILVNMINEFNFLNLSEEIRKNISNDVYNKFYSTNTPFKESIFSCGKNNAMLLDSRKGVVKYPTVNFEDFSLLIIYDETLIEDMEYQERERMNESVSAHMIVDSKFKHEFLSDFNIYELNECKDEVRDFEFKRIRHAISENNRIHDLCKSLDLDDIVKTGIILTNSQISIVQDYEMCTKQQDVLCNLVFRHNALGAKMISSKYNSSVLVLVKDLQIPNLVKNLSQEYKNRFGTEIVIVQTNIY